MRALLAFAVSLVVLALAGGASAQSPTLFGTVGPGFDISLADASGNLVTRLDPGTYTIQIDDRASAHNFHLTGPGVDQSTTVGETGMFTWTVTLAAGTYRYQCDPHASTMNGSLTVGTPLPPPTTAPPPPRKQKPVLLGARVGPGAVIAVTRRGVRVKTIPAGPAVLVVSDRSGRDNFHLVGPGVDRATSRPGKASVTWRLTLRHGLYTYRSDGGPRLRGSFRAI